MYNNPLKRLLKGIVTAVFMLFVTVHAINASAGEKSKKQISVETVVVAALCDTYFPETYQSLSYIGLKLKPTVTKDDFRSFGLGVVDAWFTSTKTEQSLFCQQGDTYFANMIKSKST